MSETIQNRLVQKKKKTKPQGKASPNSFKIINNLFQNWLLQKKKKTTPQGKASPNSFKTINNLFIKNVMKIFI